MADKVTYILPPFTGGLNDSANETEVANNEATVAQNVRLTEIGSLKQRNGYTTYGSDAGDKACLGLYEYRPSSGSNKQIAVFDGASNSDAYINSGGTWTAESEAFTAGKQAHFITFNDEAVMTNGAEFKTYDGSTWADVGGSPPSNPDLIEVWQNRVFVWKTDTDNENRLFWSAAGNVDSWDTTDDSLDIPVADDGDRPVGMASSGQNTLVLFKERSIHEIYSVGVGTAQRRTISSNVGAVGPRTIVKVPNGIIFLSRGEKTPTVYFLSGGRLVDLSTRKIRTGLAGLNHSQLANACGMYYDSKFYVSVPTSGVAYNDVTYVLDLAVSSADNPVWVKDTGYSPSVWAMFESSNELIPYFGEGQADSRVYQFDTGDSDNPSGTATAIDAEYRTKYFDLGNPLVRKRFRAMDVIVEAQTTTTKLKFSYDIDFTGDGTMEQLETLADASEWGTMVWGSNNWGGADVIQGNLNLRDARGKYIRFTWALESSGKTFHVYPQPVLTFHPKKVK